jgi:very-short-patch-repair endonuclease
MASPRGVVEATGVNGRERPGIVVHEGGIYGEERTMVGGIPVTTVARTLFDVAELRDERRLEKALEDRFLELCREHDLPLPQTNVTVAGREADAYWPRQRLVVEVDSWSFHGHRGAFERDRARDAAMQAEGYRVIRVTHRRLQRESKSVAGELRHILRGRAGD